MPGTTSITTKGPKIVVIGGGGGTSSIFPEIADWTHNAIAILGVSDSGGSTGRLSHELNVPIPVGDIRNVMMASSKSSGIAMLRKQRFAGNGALHGHPLGNFMVAGCITEALQQGLTLAAGIDIAHDILQVRGRVVPVAYKAMQLCMQDGQDVIRDEHQIDVYHTHSAEPKVWLEPEVPINPAADAAIRSADLIVIPGGSIYTSLLATLLAPGMAEALKARRAPIVMLANLATERHQTDSWHVADFVLALQRHGIDMDIVLYNNTQPTNTMLANYAAEGQRPVDFSPEKFARIPTVRAIGANLLSTLEYSQNPNDPIKRGLMRHDAKAVVRILEQILAEQHAAA